MGRRREDTVPTSRSGSEIGVKRRVRQQPGQGKFVVDRGRRTVLVRRTNPIAKGGVSDSGARFLETFLCWARTSSAKKNKPVPVQIALSRAEPLARATANQLRRDLLLGSFRSSCAELWPICHARNFGVSL